MAFGYSLVDLKGLNEILRNRGVFVRSLTHKSVPSSFVDKTKFRVYFDDDEDFSRFVDEEKVTKQDMELHNFNYLIFSRGVELTSVVHEDKGLFKSFTREYTLRLKFGVEFFGEWKKPWNPLQTKIDVFRLAKHPRVQAMMKKMV